eukprot:6398811-Pyramimonas_sp.AAC.2
MARPPSPQGHPARTPTTPRCRTCWPSSMISESCTPTPMGPRQDDVGDRRLQGVAVRAGGHPGPDEGVAARLRSQAQDARAEAR